MEIHKEKKEKKQDWKHHSISYPSPGNRWLLLRDLPSPLISPLLHEPSSPKRPHITAKQPSSFILHQHLSTLICLWKEGVGGRGLPAGQRPGNHLLTHSHTVSPSKGRVGLSLSQGSAACILTPGRPRLLPVSFTPHLGITMRTLCAQAWVG